MRSIQAVVMLAVLGFAGSVLAQTTPSPDTGAAATPPPSTTTTGTTTPDTPPPASDTTAPPDPNAHVLSDEQLTHQEQHAPVALREPTDPYEAPREGYHFVGFMYRHLLIPRFAEQLFAAEGFDVFQPGFGLEYNYRSDNFTIGAALWWQGLAFRGPFRGKSDGAMETEILSTGGQGVFDFGLIYAAASFLWAFPLTDWFAIEVGADLGLGVVVGTVTRTEAYPSSERTAGTTNPNLNGWTACDAAGRPMTSYCGPTVSGGQTDADGTNGEHYNVVARRWSQGGSAPDVFPWIGPRVALRVKPIHQLQLRAEVGTYNLFLGFWFGLSAAYGI